MKKYLKELLYYLLAGLIIWYCMILITDGVHIKQSIISSIEMCMNIIIPSLFAFMAVSGIVVSSGLYRLLSKPFSLFSRYVLGMPSSLFSIFLISNIAGYPIGAKLLSDMYDKRCIDVTTAQVMQCCCFGAGPAFLCYVVGLELYGNTTIGLIIFLSCAISNAIIAAVVCRIADLKVTSEKSGIHFSSEIITDSVLSAGKSLVGVCTLIVFFSTFLSALDHYGLLGMISHRVGIKGADRFLRSMLDISNLSGLQSPSYAAIPVIAGVCSFGGICVFMQIKTLTANRYSLKYFLLTRPFACILSYANCLWLKKIMLPESMQAFAESEKTFVKMNNFVPSVCLILMIFLLKIKKRVAFSKRV